MLTLVLSLIFFAIVVFILIVGLQPAAFTITRSATIPAPPSVIFDEVNDFHRWNAWSPWAKMDPDAKNTFDGEPSGVGSIFTWSGNNKVGEGKMAIMDNRPNQWIRLSLEFIKPFQATHNVEFTFEPAPTGTKVTWSMSGKNNFVAKAFVLLMDCDKMIDGQYEQGLKNLADVVANKAVATTV